MAASTPRQEIQQALSWKLRMVTGAKGNIYPRERHLTREVSITLVKAHTLLQEAEDIIRYELAHIPKLDKPDSAKSTSAKPKKEPIT